MSVTHIDRINATSGFLHAHGTFHSVCIQIWVRVKHREELRWFEIIADALVHSMSFLPNAGHAFAGKKLLLSTTAKQWLLKYILFHLFALHEFQTQALNLTFSRTCTTTKKPRKKTNQPCSDRFLTNAFGHSLLWSKNGFAPTLITFSVPHWITFLWSNYLILLICTWCCYLRLFIFCCWYIRYVCANDSKR